MEVNKITDMEHKASIESALGKLNEAVLLAAESGISVSLHRCESAEDIDRYRMGKEGVYVTTFKADYVKQL